MKNTYYKNEKSLQVIDVLQTISLASNGVTVTDLMDKVDIKEASLRNYLQILLDKEMVEKIEDRFFIGQRAALLWSRRVAFLKMKQQAINKNISELEV